MSGIDVPQYSLSVNGEYQRHEKSATFWRATHLPVERVARIGDWSPSQFSKLQVGDEAWQRNEAKEPGKRANLAPAVGHGYRDKAHWLRCGYLFADVDGGLTLNDARRLFEGYECVFVTSRNHQKAKNGLTNDRFHVLFPRHEPYTDINAIETDLRALCAQYSFCDKSCTNADRFFFGFADAKIFWNHGREFNPEPLPPPPVRTRYIPTRPQKGSDRLVFIISQVRRIVSGRNNFVFRASQWARREGFSESEIQAAILSSEEGASLSSESPAEFAKAIRREY